MVSLLNGDYPKTAKVADKGVQLRLLTATDREAILTFAHHLPESDLLFLRRDITQPEAVDAWLRDVETGRAISLLVEATDDAKPGLVGYASLYHHQWYWNRHVGEIRLLVTAPYRGHGLEARLIRELLVEAAELKLEKVITYMTVDDKASRRIVEDLGFTAEAILADWVKTRDDRLHDLLIMSASLVERNT